MNYSCVTCGKSFTSQKIYEAHAHAHKQTSKKNTKKVKVQLHSESSDTASDISSDTTESINIDSVEDMSVTARLARLETLVNGLMIDNKKLKKENKMLLKHIQNPQPNNITENTNNGLIINNNITFVGSDKDLNKLEKNQLIQIINEHQMEKIENLEIPAAYFLPMQVMVKGNNLESDQEDEKKPTKRKTKC